MNTTDNENEIPSSALVEECDMCIHSIAKTDCKLCRYNCIHGRQKSKCKECRGSSICIHNRQKSRCKECGGSAYCIHGRQKSSCKECGGSAYCIHNRQKSSCKECGGSAHCIHNRQKSQCKECGGSSICIHNRIKSQCKECGGASICDHGRQKSICKVCGGGSICIHGKRKTICKVCGGGSICIHNRIKSICKECGGGSVCEHGKQKSFCKECGGSRICIHNKVRSNCKECNGSRICKHNIFKSRCKDCGGSQLCKSYLCETIKNKKYNGYCARCYIHLFPDEPISKNYKTKEYAVLEFIIENYPEHTWINDKKIEGGCSKKRPDIFLDLLTHSIIIEIDENQHRSYNNCEIKRINLLFEDLGDRHIVFIRFNPDDYIDKDENKITSCWCIDRNGLSSVKKTKRREWSNRLDTLKNIVDKYLNIDEIDIFEPITNQHLFYDEIEYDDEDDCEYDE